MGKNPDVFEGELEDCAICGFTYNKKDLKEQRGKLVCDKCLDDDEEDT